MKKHILSFIILVGVLFLGIAIMIKPTTFISPSMPNQSWSSDQPLAGRIVPKSIIMLGSALTIIGVIGLSVQGFIIFRESEFDTRMKF